MRFKRYMLFVTIRISLMCQKLDLIENEVTHEYLKCMGIMQDNLCHPYILSTTVLSDPDELCILRVLFAATVVHRVFFVGQPLFK